MLANVPKLQSLPEQFPIFPLTGALLLPGGRLPLNIFEPRYLAMTEDALAGGRHIGMIQPNAAEPAGATGPALHRIGCIGRLISFAETDDGRYLITLGGVIRFAVAEELQMARGYRRVRGDYTAFTADLEPPEPPDQFTDAPMLDRGALLTSLRGYFARHGFEANWDALDEMSDVLLVATLAMACPFSPLEKQALLEAPSFIARAETLTALLHIHTHGAPDDPGRRPS
jgi:Lon protease-like protein